jgi:hypothetical protein
MANRGAGCRAESASTIISGDCLLRYAQETDNRRQSNREQVNCVAALAMKRGKSVDFAGYWQRHIKN